MVFLPEDGRSVTQVCDYGRAKIASERVRRKCARFRRPDALHP
jgi:hypothetical protein